jgi:hypothetical protein
VVLEEIVKKNPDNCLVLVIKVYITAVVWSQKVDTLLEEASSASQQQQSLSIIGGTSSADPHHHLSYNTNATTTPSNSISVSNHFDPTDWASPLFEAFVPIQQNYSILETNLLNRLIDGAIAPIYNPDKRKSSSSSSAATSEPARLLSDVLPYIFNQAESAAGRCFLFTAGFGCVGLIPALDDFFQKAAGRIETRLSVLSSSAAVGSLHHRHVGNSGGFHEDDDDEDDLGLPRDDLVGGKFNVAKFQVGLKFLAVAKTALERLSGFESGLRRQLRGLGSKFADESMMAAMVSSSSVESLNHPGAVGIVAGAGGSSSSGNASDVVNKYKTVESPSSLTALRLSTLNSFRLHSLVASLADEPKPNTTTTLTATFLFTKALDSFNKVAQSARKIAFDSVSSSVSSILSEAPKEDYWLNLDQTQSAPTSSIGEDSNSTAIVQIPTFSLSPLPYIVKLGEYLLTLPQHLELNSDSDGAMAFQIEKLPHITVQDVQSLLSDFRAQEEQEEEEKEGIPNVDGKGSGTLNNQPLQEEDVIHLWITSVARLCMDEFVKMVGKVPGGMGPRAKRQVSSDAEYIVKVFEAMDVEPSEQLRGFIIGLK